MISRGGLWLPWLTAANAPMPAARISSGPSASKRRCSLPPAISSAQAARASGLSSFAGALTTSRQRFAQAAATFARRAASAAAPAPGPQRTSRSILALLVAGLPAPVRVGAEDGAVDDRPPLLLGRRGRSPRRPRRPSAPPTSSVRAATRAAAVRRRSASSARLPRPTAPTRAAASRPSACRSVTRPSSPCSSPGVDEPGQPALDQPVEPLRGAGQRHGVANGEDEDVGLDPSGGRLDDVDLHERGGMLSESGANERAPFEGSAPRRRAPDTERARERSFTLSPQPAPSPPRANTSPLEALLLGGLPRAG